jgi:hypothetical protein
MKMSRSLVIYSAEMLWSYPIPVMSSGCGTRHRCLLRIGFLRFCVTVSIKVLEAGHYQMSVSDETMEESGWWLAYDYEVPEA